MVLCAANRMSSSVIVTYLHIYIFGYGQVNQVKYRKTISCTIFSFSALTAFHFIAIFCFLHKMQWEEFDWKWHRLIITSIVLCNLSTCIYLKTFEKIHKITFLHNSSSSVNFDTIQSYKYFHLYAFDREKTRRRIEFEKYTHTHTNKICYASILVSALFRSDDDEILGNATQIIVSVWSENECITFCLPVIIVNFLLGSIAHKKITISCVFRIASICRGGRFKFVHLSHFS